MRTGLAASTVTPGMAAPETSRTVPVMMLCAYAVDDNIIVNTNTYHAPRAALRAMLFPSSCKNKPLRLAIRHTTRGELLAQGETGKPRRRDKCRARRMKLQVAGDWEAKPGRYLWSMTNSCKPMRFEDLAFLMNSFRKTDDWGSRRSMVPGFQGSKALD